MGFDGWLRNPAPPSSDGWEPIKNGMFTTVFNPGFRNHHLTGLTWGIFFFVNNSLKHQKKRIPKLDKLVYEFW